MHLTTGKGTWLLALGSLAGLIVSIVDYVGPNNGIDHSEGALLVVVSTILMLIATALLPWAGRTARGFAVLLVILILLDILGTGFAAYMLEADLLIAAMAIALIGWLVRTLAPRPAPPALQPARSAS